MQRVQFAHEQPSEAESLELGDYGKIVEMEETAMYGADVNSLGQRLFRIIDHDLVFFFGDFNYRIVEGISTEEVFEKVVSGDLAWLRDNDQLNVERKPQAFLATGASGEQLISVHLR